MPIEALFVGEDSVVDGMTSATVPERDLGGVSVKGVDTVKLALLRGRLGAMPFKEALSEFPLLRTLSDDGPWVCRVSPTLVKTLAELSESETELLAGHWATEEEWIADGISDATVATYLRDLIRLSRTAHQGSKHLFLWICL